MDSINFQNCLSARWEQPMAVKKYNSKYPFEMIDSSAHEVEKAKRSMDRAGERIKKSQELIERSQQAIDAVRKHRKNAKGV